MYHHSKCTTFWCDWTITGKLHSQWKFCRWSWAFVLSQVPLKQTANLQTDTVSLSLVTPCILDLQSFPHCKSVRKAMLNDVNKCFTCLLDPTAANFITLPSWCIRCSSPTDTRDDSITWSSQVFHHKWGLLAVLWWWIYTLSTVPCCRIWTT